jgi:hypothetical protein
MALLRRRLDNLPMKAMLLAICAALGLASLSGCDATTGGPQVRSQASEPFPYNSPY